MEHRNLERSFLEDGLWPLHGTESDLPGQRFRARNEHQRHQQIPTMDRQRQSQNCKNVSPQRLLIEALQL